MRVFTAIECTDGCKEHVREYLESCQRAGLAGRAISPGNAHLTLHFLGEQPSAVLPSILEAMEVVSGRASFSLTFDHLGSFLQGGKKLLWMGIKPSVQAENLYRDLGVSLRERGFSLENRPFRPHLTLIRQLLADVSDFPPLQPFSLPVSAITLFESLRVEGRLTYRPIGRIPFLE